MTDHNRHLFLIWPTEWPQDSVRADLHRPAQMFRFIRPEDPRTWVHLRARGSETTVLDPENAAYGELLALIQMRRVQHVKGLDACKAAIGAAEAAHG